MKIIILLSYFILIIGVGIFSWRKIKIPLDYLLAGKKGGTLQVAGSLMATILGGSAILGSVNLAGKQEWASMWYLLAASAGLWMLLPLVKKVNKFGKFTLANLLGQFYGEPVRKVASVIIPIAWTGIVAAQIIAASKILFSFFGTSYETAVIISGVFFITYTLIGGQVSILKTDFIQAIIILIGLIFCTIFFVKLPDLNIPKISDSFPFNAAFSPFDLIILVLTFSSAFVVGPDIYSRVFCAKNERVARKSVITVATLLIPIAFVLTYFGVVAFHNLPANSLSGSVALIELINYYLPDWMVGIMAAALLSAVLSSADTTLLTASMMLTELIEADINNKKSLKTIRWFVIGIGALSILIALKITSIIGSLLLALAFYSGAFIIPTIAALMNLKVNKKLSITAMILGGSIALAGKIADTTFDLSIGNYMIIAAFVVNLGILLIPGKANRAPQS